MNLCQNTVEHHNISTMEPLLSLLIQSAMAIFLFMVGIFFLAIYKKDNSIVDIAWGIGFMVIAAICLFASPQTHPIQLIITTCIFIWGARLAIHIRMRKKDNEEDFRYKNWRDSWKCFYLRSFFQIYMLQGTLMLIIAAPLYTTALTPTQHWLTTSIGLIIFLVGFGFEAIGDWQLMQFKKDKKNKGKIMTTGLWSTTRHPNYFGEVTLWWGIWLIAIPSSWLSIISPLMITFLILKVSGIPMLEEKYQERADWKKYANKTPAFFPRL